MRDGRLPLPAVEARARAHQRRHDRHKRARQAEVQADGDAELRGSQGKVPTRRPRQLLCISDVDVGHHGEVVGAPTRRSRLPRLEPLASECPAVRIRRVPRAWAVRRGLAGNGEAAAYRVPLAQGVRAHDPPLEVRSGRQVERQVVKLKEQMFKQSQELFEHRQREANLIAEISGAQASAKNLNHKIHTLDQESLRQQELVYNAEFQIQQMERKVARAGGERSDEEKIALNARITQVQAVLDETKEQQRMLRQQCKKVVDELAVTRRKLVDVKDARKKGEARIAELQLVNDAAVKTLREHAKEREEFMVRHDVLKLEVKHLREQLHGHADEVFGLANRKFQLEQSMEERKHEISVHRDVQRAALKAAGEERHRVAMETKARQSKVKTLRSKYESLVAAARPSDGGGEERSQAYFIIQAAQKREELQREGDELDGKIRRAEREMKALENTLKHLTDRNTRFRLSFHKADPSSAEAKECRQLEAQTKVAKDNLFKKRKELQRLTADFEEDTRRHRQMQRQGQQLNAHLEHLQDAHGQVDAELQEQVEKLGSVEARVSDAVIEHRRAKGYADDFETLEEKKFNAEGLRETNANVLYTLGQLAREFPEMRDTLQAVLQSQGLDVPSRPPSRISRGSSRASYRTASRGASSGGQGGGLDD